MPFGVVERQELFLLFHFMNYVDACPVRDERSHFDLEIGSLEYTFVNGVGSNRSPPFHARSDLGFRLSLYVHGVETIISFSRLFTNDMVQERVEPSQQESYYFAFMARSCRIFELNVQVPISVPIQRHVPN